MQCSNEGFTGLEFAGGIPGTVGGATYMNAGANGQVILVLIFWRKFSETFSGLKD